MATIIHVTSCSTGHGTPEQCDMVSSKLDTWRSQIRHLQSALLAVKVHVKKQDRLFCTALKIVSFLL